MSIYLIHHGVKGQKWGIRRFQNADGTLTAQGKTRYYQTDDHGLDRYKNRAMKKFIKRETKDRRKFEKKYMKVFNKQAVADAAGKEGRAERLQKKVDKMDAREKERLMTSGLEALGIDTMTRADMTAERRKVGARVVKSILVAGATFASATLTSSYIISELRRTKAKLAKYAPPIGVIGAAPRWDSRHIKRDMRIKRGMAKEFGLR